MKDFSGSEKFLIMCDIEKRAKQLTVELTAKGGLIVGDSIDGYKYLGKNWREAKEAGFTKETDGQWIGFTNHGDGAYSDRAYDQALQEKKLEMEKNGINYSFLNSVFHYEYLL